MTLDDIDADILSRITKTCLSQGVRPTQVSSEQHNIMYTGIANAMTIQLLQEISAKLDRNHREPMCSLRDKESS